MKIVHYTSVWFLDAELPLIKNLRDAGHEVHLFIHLPCFGLRSPLLDIGKQDPRSELLPASGCPELMEYSGYLSMENVWIVNRVSRKSLSRETRQLMRQVMDKIQEINPDVVNITSVPDLYNKCLYKLKDKLVLTLHDPFEHSGEKSFRRTLFRQRAMRRIKRFILLNGKQKELFCKTYSIAPERVHVASLGLMEFIAATPDPGMKNVLFFGRISQYKGVEYLCEAFREIREMVPGASLTIAGGGRMYFDIEPYLKYPHVQLINRYIPYAELGELIARSSVVVCPYTDATQSGVVSTAFAAGRPVVATRTGGLPESVEDGKTGLLVPPRDAHAIAEAVTMLLHDAGKRARMVQNINEKYADGPQSWKRIAEGYIEFFGR